MKKHITMGFVTVALMASTVAYVYAKPCWGVVSDGSSCGTGKAAVPMECMQVECPLGDRCVWMETGGSYATCVLYYESKN